MARGEIMKSFQSWLSPSFERFVAIKRAGGAQYSTQRSLLANFDRFLCDHAPEPPLQRETVIRYLASLDRLSPRSRQNIVSVVWQSLAYAQKRGERIKNLPPRPPNPPTHFRLREPRIVSHSEIRAILAQARSLGPKEKLRSATYSTILGLLFATGMRIGEAVALNVGDINDGLLNVRQGKFGKSRILPLHPSTSRAIEQYLIDPRRPIDSNKTSPLFVSGRCRRLSVSFVDSTFRRLCVSADVSQPFPRPHDLRHSFVIQRMEAWYKNGGDINSLLPVLSTYLGHVSIENTRAYLRANGSLLEEASRRFSARTIHLDGVLP